MTLLLDSVCLEMLVLAALELDRAASVASAVLPSRAGPVCDESESGVGRGQCSKNSKWGVFENVAADGTLQALKDQMHTNEAQACRASSDQGTDEYKQAVSFLKEYISDRHTPKHGWRRCARMQGLMMTR